VNVVVNKSSVINIVSNEKNVRSTVVVHPKSIIMNEVTKAQMPDILDYMKSIFKCRSKYTRESYGRLKDMIRGRFELGYLIKQMQDSQNLIEMTLDEGKKSQINSKKVIRKINTNIVEEGFGSNNLKIINE
jgi:hypothetical protein